MKTLTIEPKKVIAKIIVTLYGIKSKEIEAQLHISQSLVSMYMNGERNCTDIDIYMIEKVFGIKVKEYDVSE